MKTALNGLVLIGLLSACSEAPQHDYVPVAAFTPNQSTSYEVKRLFIGRVSASQQANLSFETPGKVESIWVDQGDRVEQGQPLAQLDISLLTTERSELSAQLKDTNVQLTLAQTKLQRQRNLIAKGFVAQQQLDEFESRVNRLAAAATRLRASLSANAIRLDKAVLKAPFTGVVSQRFVDAGMVVDPSHIAFQVIDQGGVELNVGIPAQLVPALVTGNQYPVEIAGRETMASYVAASAHIDLATQTVPVRFALSDVNARDGQMGIVSITEVHHSVGYWIPVDAVTEGMRGSWVVYGLNARDGKSNLTKTIQRSAIEILHVNDDQLYVKADLPRAIMAGGLHKVVPGQVVEVVANVTPVPAIDEALLQEDSTGSMPLSAAQDHTSATPRNHPLSTAMP